LDWVTMAECKHLERVLSEYKNELAHCYPSSKPPALVTANAPLGCEASIQKRLTALATQTGRV
jgi:hypothetical protein